MKNTKLNLIVLAVFILLFGMVYAATTKNTIYRGKSVKCTKYVIEYKKLKF